jgi:rfaE bifunctional protein nucleotidyltransferase chain/domain
MQPRDVKSKIWRPEEVPAHAERVRREGSTIVFTNGCFDLLHSGHVLSLAGARRLGDFLIVGVNSDGSVAALKGPNRPLIPLEERLLLLAAMEVVDAVTWFEDLTPHALIRVIRPHVHTKGGDYRIEEISEAGLVRELGGRVEILPVVEGRSTTALLERIRDRLLG